MSKREYLLEELDELHNQVIDIVMNRCLDYIDDLDMLDSDINSDLENDIFENMDVKELEEYVKHVRCVLAVYKEEV